MLKAARGETRCFPNIHVVAADAGWLPFATGSFDAVTCSHAFYELKGETQTWALEEILRVLGPKGVFLMMEHDVPSNFLPRTLFYVRLTIAGSGRAVAFLRREREVLGGYFGRVEKVSGPGGRSKVLICRKSPGSSQ
jgi:demethylmenaquinone methyltransferase/2-methoxy-6-polyprenyl-1,4-benzoquinol methylase